MLGANGGKGRFEVDGAGVANIGTDNAADDGFWGQNSNSVLAAYVTNGTLGSIYVAHLSGAPGTYSSGNVIFMPGSRLKVGFLSVTNPGAWDTDDLGRCIADQRAGICAGHGHELELRLHYQQWR